MKIDHNSYGTLALVYVIAAAILVPMFAFHCDPWALWPVTILTALIVVWQTYFFRVPERTPAGSDKLVSSVADGKVVIIEKAYEKEFLKRDCIQVSVYMDFFDVHANFWPVTGEVTYYNYHAGKHFLAFKPKASDDNEHTCCCVRTSDGKDVFFKQIAGTFARRIVCYGKDGGNAVAGEQCGIIKFGSRIDLYLPLDANIKVSLGDYVRAAETIIAEI